MVRMIPEISINSSDFSTTLPYEDLGHQSLCTTGLQRPWKSRLSGRMFVTITTRVMVKEIGYEKVNELVSLS
ncbi:hypothetical protein TNCV_3248921 [Trichonephila clavipes]|nr:hypothetical protein TNCV_3248921 [Trichonephila clavipes]